MKIISTLVSLIIVCMVIGIQVGDAAIPQTISIQGRLMDSTGAVIPDGTYQVIFTIYTDSISSVAVWTSGVRSVTVTDGLFSYLLGSAVPLTPNLLSTTIEHWLGIKVGSDPEMSPRIRLSSVVSAYRALQADSLTAGAISSSQILDNSLTQDDLAPGSVGPSELAAFAVQNVNIAPHAVTSDKIEVGAVNSNKIADSSIALIDLSSGAVPSAGSTILNGSTSNTAPTTIDQFTVVVPGPGVLLITVTGQFYLDLDAPASTSLIDNCALGLCESANSSVTCGSSWTTRYYQDSEDASPNPISHTEQFILQRTITVYNSGVRTFYLNGSAGASSGASLFLSSNATVTVLFIPKALTVTGSNAKKAQTMTTPE